MRQGKDRDKTDARPGKGASRWARMLGDAATPEGRQRRIVMSVTGAVLASIVVALIAWQVGSLLGGGAATGVKTYEDSKNHFSLQYPASWQRGKQSTGSAALTIFDPKGTKISSGYVDQILVYVTQAGSEGASQPTDSVVGDLLAQFKTRGMPDATLSSPLSQTTIGGASGWTWTFSFTMESVPVKFSEYSLLSNGSVYLVGLKAAEEHWLADKPLFDSVIASFRTGS
jgi:hypothetical protein